MIIFTNIPSKASDLWIMLVILPLIFILHQRDVERTRKPEKFHIVNVTPDVARQNGYYWWYDVATKSGGRRTGRLLSRSVAKSGDEIISTWSESGEYGERILTLALVQ